MFVIDQLPKLRDILLKDLKTHGHFYNIFCKSMAIQSPLFSVTDRIQPIDFIYSTEQS